MVAREKFEQMAEMFMTVVRPEARLDVVLYDCDARIIQASDSTRIGQLNTNVLDQVKGGGIKAVRTFTRALEEHPDLECASRVIRDKDTPVGGFSITGPPEVIRPLVRVSAWLFDLWIQEVSHYNELEERVDERTLILNQEIDARRQAEKILKESQARFEAFTRATPDILFVFDEDGRYVEIFTSSRNLLVAEVSALKGRLISDSLPSDVADIHHDAIQKVAATGEKQSFEYQLTVPKGTRWFESRAALIKGLDHEKKLVASSVRDVTRRKLAERQASERQKLTGVIETAGAVCHEFSQPLQIITGACELLNTYPELGPEIRQTIHKISEQVQRMGKLNLNLMNITAYKTRDYLSSKIIDIEQSTTPSTQTEQNYEDIDHQ